MLTLRDQEAYPPQTSCPAKLVVPLARGSTYSRALGACRMPVALSGAETGRTPNSLGMRFLAVRVAWGKQTDGGGQYVFHFKHESKGQMLQEGHPRCDFDV